MFNSLSLRGRFLITPIIGIILTLILYFASNAVIRSHADLFQKLHDNNLPQISAISRSITLLANNHNALTDTLVAAISNPDEEKIYIQGRAVLNQLHQIEVELLENIHLAHRGIVQYDTILEKIRLAFIYYQESSIRAIELSSVNSQRAIKELIYVSKASQQLNESFLTLSDYHTEHITDTSKLLGSTLYDQNIVTALAVILILVMIVSALYFSDRMSSEIQQAEQMIIEAREEAERSNQDKSDFLSRMSHELRTPLNAIVGFGELLDLDSSMLNSNQQENIRYIMEAGEHLRHLVNELLDLATIQSGKTDITKNIIPVKSIVEECITMIHPQAANKKIEIINNIKDTKCKIQADHLRLKKVLLNLLSNAVKYICEKGQIMFDCKQVSKDRLQIRVTNTGSVLSRKEISKLFTPFERFDSKKDTEGTGIGLVIAKHMVEQMDGTIAVESIRNGEIIFFLEFLLVNDVKELS
ncbi:MAG: HAMP domain-containing histidine kinase [Gammaproteobacteria bacterium]|nr:HAMP domain-containing histidine kinase [Gammaproteobacteria bacterium]